ncbi:hypothetical protein [Limnoraphis robusta]|uniref:Uncharacterized protein n=1 Tax=Limnoraphis robusta CCNP1315 TaxID=3110306 RepID=A0ABU5U1M8_9CYAN|nr:hypothetical protein [Limnoraphis robusta]MEA5495797.1 hypothetical protein [Limnoraphis robusta BA-68 BA1]MEA5521093.1 hypothetical protein [Limnoraphis robusta CCNP1315]MEA5543462.1 hypothetical protein [Limnoraphis robusta CCNP1324]
MSRTQIAATIARLLSNSLVNWAKIFSGIRYFPQHYQEHTEVRVNFEQKEQRQRLRLDFLAVVRWSYKRPKDIFAVEI